MNNKKPRDPLYPKGFEETKELKKQISENYPKPSKKDEELTLLKRLNRKIGIYLHPNSVEITDDEKKEKNWSDNYHTDTGDIDQFSILFYNL